MSSRTGKVRLGDELVKASLSFGYGNLVDAVETILEAVELPASLGLWEVEVEFQGEWFEDEGNQKNVGIHLTDQDLFLVDVIKGSNGSVKYVVSWSDDIEWRKGRRDGEEKKKNSGKNGKKVRTRGRRTRDPNDPDYQEYLAVKESYGGKKEDFKASQEYKEWQASRREYEEKKRRTKETLEYKEFQAQRDEALRKRKQEKSAKEVFEYMATKEKYYARIGGAPAKTVLPPFPELPLLFDKVQALPERAHLQKAKVARSVVAEEGHFISSAAPVPGHIVEAKPKPFRPVKVERSVVGEEGHFITDLSPIPGMIVEATPKKSEISSREAKSEQGVQPVKIERSVVGEEGHFITDLAPVPTRIVEASKSKKSGEQAPASAESVANTESTETSAFLVVPSSGPREVTLTEEERLICRCGQSDFFPFCDMSCKKYNEQHGTSYRPWKASMETVGADKIYVCGCGESQLFRAKGEPLCDDTCGQLEATKQSTQSENVTLENGKKEAERKAQEEEQQKRKRMLEEENQRELEREMQQKAQRQQEETIRQQEEESRREVLRKQEEDERARLDERVREEEAKRKQAAREREAERQKKEQEEKKRREEASAMQVRALLAAEREVQKEQELPPEIGASYVNKGYRSWKDCENVPLPIRFLELAAHRRNGTAYQVYANEHWISVSWTEYAAQVREAAQALIGCKTRKGDHVLLVAESRPEWTIVALAAQSCGAVLVVAPTSCSPEQLLEITTQTRPVACIVDTVAQWEKIQKFSLVVDSVKHIVCMQTLVNDPRALSWRSFLDKSKEADSKALGIRLGGLKSSDVASVVYTDNRMRTKGGSMRGVRLSFANESFAADRYTQLLESKEEDKILVFMPFADTTTRAVIFHQSINSGAAVFYCTEIERLHASLTSVQPTIVFSAPVVWERFEAVIRSKLGDADPAVLPAAVKEKLRRFIGCHNLRTALSGTDFVHPKTVKFYSGIGITLRNVYAKAALSGICALDMSHDPTPGCTGKAVKGVQVRVSGKQLEVLGPNVFLGYQGHSNHSSWFATGDDGDVAPNGDITLYGAQANTFRLRNGTVVHPERVELELRLCPFISGALVFGEGKDHCGAIVALERAALDATARKHGLTFEQLAAAPATLSEVAKRIEAVNEQISQPGKKIRVYHVLAREFSVKDAEITPTLQNVRNVLFRRFDDMIQQLYLEGSNNK